MRFFTSDLHLGHENIIGYCNRPYDSVDEMNEDLVRRWNQVVTPDDEVIVVGDFAMGKLNETLPLAGLLNGGKTLVPGNHDRMFGCTPTKFENAWLRYKEAGFDGAIDYRRENVGERLAALCPDGIRECGPCGNSRARRVRSPRPRARANAAASGP